MSRARAQANAPPADSAAGKQRPELFQLRVRNIGPVAKLRVDTRGIFLDGPAHLGKELHDTPGFSIGRLLGDGAPELDRATQDPAVELDEAGHNGLDQIPTLGLPGRTDSR